MRLLVRVPVQLACGVQRGTDTGVSAVSFHHWSIFIHPPPTVYDIGNWQRR